MDFVRPLASNARIVAEGDGRPLDRYAVMLQVLGEDGAWRTIMLFDNAHGQHDRHDYTGFEKQSAVRFMDGAPREVVPVAIRQLVDDWEAIVHEWRARSGG